MLCFLVTQEVHELELDRQNRLLPVDYGDVCLNYDKAWFIERGIDPPADLWALIEAQMLAEAEPETGSESDTASGEAFGEPGDGDSGGAEVVSLSRWRTSRATMSLIAAAAVAFFLLI